MTTSHSLIEYAPSGVSAFSGPTIGFYPAGPGELGVHAKIPLCSLAAPAASTPGYLLDAVPGISINLNTLTFQGVGACNTLALSPLVHAGVTGALSGGGGNTYQSFAAFSDCNFTGLVGQAFDKYVVDELELSYSPTTTTIDTTNFSLVFTEDPDHPTVGMGSYSTNATPNWPTYALAKNSVNSVNFAAWSTWSRKFTLTKGNVFYTSPRISDDIKIANISTVPPFQDSDLRFSHFGAVSVFANNTNGDSKVSAPKGELYMTVKYRFFDMTPVSSSLNIPFTMTEFMKLVGGDKLYIMDEKEDGEQPGLPRRSPPTHLTSGFYRVLPSHKLGNNRRYSQPVYAPVSPQVVSRPSPYAPPKVRKETKTTSKAPPIHRAVKQVRLVHVIAKLHGKRSVLPKEAQHHISNLKSLSSKKPSKWKDTAKGVIKSLVKEVPVVGGILGELTDAVGGKLLDWIGGLF